MAGMDIGIDPSTVTRDFAEAHAFDNAPEPKVPEYIPSLTVQDFLNSTRYGATDEMRLCILMGPRGEGKTTAGLYACMAMAISIADEGLEHLLPIRVAVIRDTWVNLARTTINSFEENQRAGLPIEWKDGRHEAILTDPETGQAMCHFYFFGMDNRDDADKLQGFQCGILWLEEVAPAADIKEGIPPEALGIAGTSLRQKGIPPRILVTMNPPDEEHWIMKVEETLAALDLDEINVHRFTIPRNERSEWFRILAARNDIAYDEKEAWERAAVEFEAYSRRNEVLLSAINREDLVARLVRGEIGGVTIGEAIVPEFAQVRHCSMEWVQPVPGIPVTRCWDAGLTPSTVWYQKLPNQNVNILGSRMSINKAMGQHIVEQVLAFQKATGVQGPQPGSYTRKAVRGYSFKDIGDPALAMPNQGKNAEETARWVLETMLGANFIAGPVAWSARRQALKTAFYRPPAAGSHKDRRALVQIYKPECSKPKSALVESLGGKAHYKTDPVSGKIMETVEMAKKASGLYFQELDALAYGFAEELPAEDWLKRVTQANAPARRRYRSWMGR